MYALIEEAGLDRFYELGGGAGYPIVRGQIDHKWLESITAGLRAASGSKRLFLDVQGVHCAACVWVIETLFHRRIGAGQTIVNPAAGTIELTAAHDLDLAA